VLLVIPTTHERTRARPEPVWATPLGQQDGRGSVSIGRRVAPDPRHGPLRFFYCPQFQYPDNLYFTVVSAIFENRSDLTDKPKYLAELKARGWWLIDAVPYPINSIKNDRPKRRAIQASFPDLQRVMIRPDVRPSTGAIICMPRVFEELGESIKTLGIPILHQHPIPFPILSRRAGLVEVIRSLAQGEWHGGAHISAGPRHPGKTMTLSTCDRVPAPILIS